MSIYKLLILAFLFSSNLINAQSSYQLIEDKLQEVSKIKDLNEKKYQLALLVNSFKNILVKSAESYELGDTAIFKKTKTSDSKYTVYYYNTLLEAQTNRLDWFIVYGDINQKKVVHQSININLNNYNKNSASTDFKIEVTPLQKGDSYIYPLTITHLASMKIYKQYVDVASQCLFENLLNYKSDTDRLQQNDLLEKRLQVLFDEPEYFENKFEGLIHLSTLHSDDGKVKVCTWNVELSEVNTKFFGSVITKRDDGTVTQIPLYDKTESIRSPEKAQLTHKKWYGAVYYDIITVKDKPSNYYILLGFKPNNEMTKKKVIETLALSSNKQVRFGNSVFQNDRFVDKRVIFEFSASVNMMLRYERENERIILDHLAPPEDLYKGNYRFYGPDFSYDGYLLEKGRWKLQREIDVRNPKPIK
ncbi:hypothetical protein [Saccharicrinis aurantiacus]|uniref:hypothetical protein n=1 Tax=Saccharicrinis aurantiacus TaxID=1849719 RepID=UPI0024921748|nr:hypothetical protein [Saccharicrinis aurantiacus]